MTDIQFAMGVTVGNSPWLALLAATLAVTGAEAAAPKQAVVPDIVYTARSWGSVTEQWSIKAGRVEYRKPKKVVFGGGPVELQVKRFRLASADRRRLRQLLDRFVTAAALPDKCDNYIPDGPYGDIVWVDGAKETRVPFNGSCVSGDNAKKAAAGFAVGHLIGDLAKQRRVIETKIVK